MPACTYTNQQHTALSCALSFLSVAYVIMSTKASFNLTGDCFNMLQVLVEYDNADWQLRQWITIKEVFQVFLVEETLAWVPCQVNGHASSSKQLYPALVGVF